MANDNTRVMVSYKYTGESVDRLDILLSTICDAVCNAGANPYCVYFAKARGSIQQKSPAEMMKIAFSQIDCSDVLLVVQSSESRSEGMLMEVGYAVASQVPVIVVTHSSVLATYLPSIADISIRYDCIDDLKNIIENLDFLRLKLKTSTMALAENSAVL